MEKLGYRPELDGLRAVAILAVVFFHGIGWPRSGFGVDVFFVLSGFLITTLLLEEHARTGAVSLRAFYLRRFFRLIPALATLLAVYLVVIVAWGLVDGTRLGMVGLAAAYVANWAGVVDLGFFTGGELGHLWSLAVEEQFYLLWPVLLLVALGRGFRLHRYILYLGLACLTIAVALAFLSVPRERLTLGTDVRGVGLMLGCGLAVLRRRGLRANHWVGLAGIAVLVYAAFTSGADSFPWIARMVLISAGTAAVILASLETDWLRRALSWKPLVLVGVLSYSLYLWHVPVMVMAEHQTVLGTWNEWARLAVTLPLTCLGAGLSFVLVERRVLGWRSSRHPRTLQTGRSGHELKTGRGLHPGRVVSNV